MGLSIMEGFTKSLAMTIVSEVGDSTFFAAAILAMRHPRKQILTGSLAALILMTIISAIFGWAAPNLISKKWTHLATTVLFFVFGFWSLWEGFTEERDSDELAEVEAMLSGDQKINGDPGKKPGNAQNVDDDDVKKKKRSIMRQLFSPIFLEAFSLTFFGEWGDKSQFATIGLAADENPVGVIFGGIVAQIVCTTAAVIGGKSLASRISEKMVAIGGGLLFIVFGIQSLMTEVPLMAPR